MINRNELLVWQGKVTKRKYEIMKNSEKIVKKIMEFILNGVYFLLGYCNYEGTE